MRALKAHTQKYFWTKNNYNSAHVLTENDFMREIRAMIKGTGHGLDFVKEIERIQSTPKKNKIEKEELIEEINLPKYIRNLLTISEDFTYWQDERKKKTFWMTHYGFRFLQEIARRTGYETEELKYLVYPELVGLLDGNDSVSRAEARARKRGCLFYHKGDKYEVVTDVDAEKFKTEIFDKELNTEVNDFRGMPASRGRVRGKVKVIMSVKELDKVEQGDILVAVMTRPDYIAGIKRAAAIVTNEGGVTCHAAIVSRELGIPCVIGTKIATKVLKDGDLVEVNANHGVVTKVK
jgi:phosphohistidine swiveling domain-containing protein/predicted transcriptional regulator